MESTPSKELSFRWLLAGGCFALLMFFFSPPWGAFRAWSRAPEMGNMIEVRRGASTLLQVAHPGIPIADPIHGGIQWRLLFPVIGHVLQLSPAWFFALAHAGCVIVLAFIITVLRRRGVGWTESALAAVTLGATSWYFASMCWLGYFDSWLVLGLLVVAFARSPRMVGLACLWAPWVDERFVIGAPLALLCRYLVQPANPGPETPALFLKKEVALPAALLAAFLLVRLGVLAGLSGPKATIAGYMNTLQIMDTPWPRVLFGIWEGLRAAWLFVVLAVCLSWPKRGRALALLAGVLAVMLVGLGTAQDFSRSMMFILPVGLLGVTLGLQAAPRWLRGALQAGAAAALLLPAHLVMNDGVNPISGFYHELAALQSPPAAIMPEIYELRAIHAMEQGNFAQAERDLTLAIRLADNPAGPSKQRGVLYASAGRWEEARRDFATMVKYGPENPEGWYLQAQSQLALGDAAAARADVEHAIRLAPDGWSSRPDVTRFLTKLGSASGK